MSDRPAPTASVLDPVPDPVPPVVDPIELARRNWARAGWDDCADGMALVTSIFRVQQLLLARIDELLRPHDLTFARFEVLMLLRFARSDALPLGKIGERLQVHPASVTNAIARLEADGLVTRRPNPDDGRSVLAAITPAGTEVVEQAVAVLNDQVFRTVPLGGDQLADGYDALRAWRAAFGDGAPATEPV